MMAKETRGKRMAKRVSVVDQEEDENEMMAKETRRKRMAKRVSVVDQEEDEAVRDRDQQAGSDPLVSRRDAGLANTALAMGGAKRRLGSQARRGGQEAPRGLQRPVEVGSSDETIQRENVGRPRPNGGLPRRLPDR